MSTQTVHELSIPELNEMPKNKRIGIVRDLESKTAKFSCSSCKKQKISSVHFSVGQEWMIEKLLCSHCFSTGSISVRKRGFFERLGRKY